MFKPLSCFLLLFAAACDAPAPAPAPGLVVLQPEGLTFRVEVKPQDPGATEFQNGDSLITLGAPKTFELSRAFVSADHRGIPALGFDIAESDWERFEEWTRSIKGKRMAVLIDGDVTMAPYVNDPLRTGGIITGGAEGFTDAEVATLLQSLQPAQR